MNVHLRERYRDTRLFKGVLAVFRKIRLNSPIGCGIEPHDRAILDGASQCSVITTHAEGS